MRRFRPILFPLVFMFVLQSLKAQETHPINGVADERTGHYAFTHATIVKDASTTIKDATMIIKDGKIISVGAGLKSPAGAVEVDCRGKFIYPSFIDAFSDYGMPAVQRAAAPGDFFARSQLTSNTKGAYSWNQAIRSETDAFKLFAVDEPKAKVLRDAGFGSVLTHVKDGIARGSGAFVSLGTEKENLTLLKDRAAAHFSLSKGSSTQSYPGSMMGVIALLRQTYLDAGWYKNKPAAEGFNASLEAWNRNGDLPHIIDANDKWNALRADRIGDEFGKQYIIRGGGNEYQRIGEIKATGATFILSLNFPLALDVDDPNDARFVSLNDLKHWELAPSNPSALAKAGISFCLTSAGLAGPGQFMANLQKALEYGLPESIALDALTKVPATILGVYNLVGTLENGKLANFLITSGPYSETKLPSIKTGFKVKNTV